jgi:hypothetical protein
MDDDDEKASVERLWYERSKLQAEIARLRGLDPLSKRVGWYDVQAAKHWILRDESAVVPEALDAWRSANPGVDYPRWFARRAPRVSDDDLDRATELSRRLAEIDVAIDAAMLSEKKFAGRPPKYNTAPRQAAEKLLAELYPRGIPPKEELKDTPLVNCVQKRAEGRGLPEMKRDTILRAAGRKN